MASRRASLLLRPFVDEWRLLPFLEGSIFLLPSLQGREADNMEYITLTELLLIIGSFIAFADLLLSFFNDNDKK